jgi:hypothetical protein
MGSENGHATIIKVNRISSKKYNALIGLLESPANWYTPEEREFFGRRGIFDAATRVDLLKTKDPKMKFVVDPEGFLTVGTEDEKTEKCVPRQYYNFELRVNDRLGVSLDVVSREHDWERFSVSYQFMANLFKIIGYIDGSIFKPDQDNCIGIFSDKSQTPEEFLYCMDLSGRTSDIDDLGLVFPAYLIARKFYIKMFERLHGLSEYKDQEELVISRAACKSAKCIIGMILEASNTSNQSVAEHLQMQGIVFPENFFESLVASEEWDSLSIAKKLLFWQTHEWWHNHLKND